ncbi:MAG: hypothetical protein DRH12_01540 [Deltaproteobacteria bacterium]|nr:MAG: hypothetical protein DRH12_01540 [Deltaproteobacteria bacterium]
MVTCNQMNKLFLVLFVCMLALIIPKSGHAKTKLVKVDTDKDGKVDQIAHLDEKGPLVKL